MTRSITGVRATITTPAGTTENHVFYGKDAAKKAMELGDTVLCTPFEEKRHMSDEDFIKYSEVVE